MYIKQKYFFITTYDVATATRYDCLHAYENKCSARLPSQYAPLYADVYEPVFAGL